MLNRIVIGKELKDKIIAPIPEYLIQERQGGGNKTLSYLSGSTVIDMLNDAFGYTWSWKVSSEWIQESQPSTNKYVNGKLEKDPSKWVKEEQGPVAHVKGILTVYLSTADGQILTIEKEGYGSKSILGKQNDQESIFKAAGTDALKKAASLYGIGLELYRNEEEQAYFDQLNYEDPWTDDLIEEFSKEREYLANYMTEYEISEEELQELVFSVTNSTYEITPDNISDIVNYIKSEIGK